MKVLALALNDLRLVLAERGAFIARLIVPVAFTIVVGIANDAFTVSEGAPALPVVVIHDLDSSELSAFFSSTIRNQADQFAFCTLGDDCSLRGGGSAATVQDALDRGAAQIGITVPSGFASSLLRGDAVTVDVVFAISDPERASQLEPIIRAAAARTTIAADAGISTRDLVVDPGVADEAAALATERAIELLSIERLVLDQSSIELPETYPLTGFRQSVPGMGSMFVMLSVLAGASMLVEERRRWTLYRTLAAPIPGMGYVLGRVLGRFLVGMMQYTVAIATGLVLGLIFGISFGSSPLLMLAVMCSFVFAASGLSVMLATMVEREQHATSLTTLLAVTLAPIGGAWWSLDIEIIPDVMRRIAFVSPFYWVIEGFRAAIHDLGFGAAGMPILILVAIGLASTGIAARRLPQTI